MTAADEYGGARYLVADVDEKAVDLYTAHLGFTVNMNAAPAFADLEQVRGSRGAAIKACDLRRSGRRP